MIHILKIPNISYFYFRKENVNENVIQLRPTTINCGIGISENLLKICQQKIKSIGTVQDR